MCWVLNGPLSPSEITNRWHAWLCFQAMGIYFRFKDEVFQGVMRPYDHVPLEKLLKDYFTDHAVMTDIAYPKVSASISKN